MVRLMSIEMLFRAYHREVFGPLLFIFYTHGMWFGLENILVSYADDATLSARIPSPTRKALGERRPPPSSTIPPYNETH